MSPARHGGSGNTDWRIGGAHRGGGCLPLLLRGALWVGLAAVLLYGYGVVS